MLFTTFRDGINHHRNSDLWVLIIDQLFNNPDDTKRFLLVKTIYETYIVLEFVKVLRLEDYNKNFFIPILFLF